MVKYADTIERRLLLAAFSFRKSATLPRSWLSRMPDFNRIPFRCLSAESYQREMALNGRIKTDPIANQAACKAVLSSRCSMSVFRWSPLSAPTAWCASHLSAKRGRNSCQSAGPHPAPPDAWPRRAASFMPSVWCTITKSAVVNGPSNSSARSESWSRLSSARRWASTLSGLSAERPAATADASMTVITASTVAALRSADH